MCKDQKLKSKGGMRQELVSIICSPFWALGARASDCVGRRPNWFAQSIVLGSLSSSKEEEGKGKEEGRKRKLSLEVSSHQN